MTGGPEFKRRFQKFARLFVEMDFQFARMVLPIALVQLGLWIEQVHLARTAVLEKTDDSLRARFVVRRFRRKRRNGLRHGSGGTRTRCEQMRQREAAKTARRKPK